MKITEKAHQDFRAHVLESYPNEASGIIVKGRYIKNTLKHHNPTEEFEIDPALLVKYQGKIEAILHSHVYPIDKRHDYDPRWPSTNDLTNWMAGNVPWGIASCEGENVSQILWMDDSEIPPLCGREYINGIADCFAVVRDYYRMQGHEIKNLPRSMGWWEEKKDPQTGVVTPTQDLLGSNWQNWGFVEITEKEATVGDAVLIKFRSQVINHSAVITGDNIITHHFYRNLSQEDELARWKRFVVKYLRYQP